MRTPKDDLAEFPLFGEASRSQLAFIRRQLTKVRVPAGASSSRRVHEGTNSWSSPTARRR